MQCGQKRRVDVLESRARAKPFNTYTDEEASFETSIPNVSIRYMI